MEGEIYVNGKARDMKKEKEREREREKDRNREKEREREREGEIHLIRNLNETTPKLPLLLSFSCLRVNTNVF